LEYLFSYLTHYWGEHAFIKAAARQAASEEDLLQSTYKNMLLCPFIW